MQLLGIAVASGTLKGVFAHGVLSGLEDAGVRADAYGGVSSSTLSIGLAATNRAREVGVKYWLDALAWTEESDANMSEVVRKSIAEYGPDVVRDLFEPDTPDVGIFAAHVHTKTGSDITQGVEAKKFGKKLLIMLLKGSSEWTDEHVTGHMFWNDPAAENRLTAENFPEVAYATTRMMHAWPDPAWIDDRAYIDGSYLKLIPDDEVRDRVQGTFIAIGSEPGAVLRSFSGDVVEPGDNTFLVTPDQQLSELGVDFEQATTEGMKLAYDHGLSKGLVLGEGLSK